MFKFDFDVEDESADETKQGVTSDTDRDPDERPFQEYSLQDLIQTLPDDISYSSVKVRDTHIPRRDLFDVRLQLMASEAQNDNLTDKAKEDQAAIEFASRPSDLVPRVYEGGMKTWECSLDLAAYVINEHVRGKKVLELGCGTAMPSLAILQSLLNEDAPPTHSGTTVFHLQDYNSSVLEYVTLPNMILVWFFSKAGESYRATIPPPSPKPDSKSKLPDVSNLTLESVPEEDEEEAQVGPESPRASYDPHAFDMTEPGDLAFPPALRSAFQDSLSTHHIELRFSSGPWNTFHPERPYDLVLTSETIYQPTSLPSLVRLLKDATCPGGKCLVAAKMVYFGVGGGIREFEAALERGGSSAKCVWEQREGVGRSIMQVVFGE
ncbi:protein-histidine N-methyltransferase, partial [Rhizoctonia solani]